MSKLVGTTRLKKSELDILSGADLPGGFRVWCSSYAQAVEKLSLLVISKIAKKVVEKVVGPFDFEGPPSPLVKELYNIAVSNSIAGAPELNALRGKWFTKEILSAPPLNRQHEGPIEFYFTGTGAAFFSLNSSFARIDENPPLPVIPGLIVPTLREKQFSAGSAPSLNFRIGTNIHYTDARRKGVLGRYLRFLNTHFVLKGIPFFGGLFSNGIWVEVNFSFGFQTFLRDYDQGLSSILIKFMGVDPENLVSTTSLDRIPISVVHHYKEKLSPEEKTFLVKAVEMSEEAYYRSGRLLNPIQRGFDKVNLLAWSDNYKYSLARARTPPKYYPRQMAPNPTGNSWETDFSKPKGQTPIFGKEMPETFTQYLKTVLGNGEEGSSSNFKTYTAEQPLSESVLVAMLPEIITPLLTLGVHFGSSGEGPMGENNLVESLYDSFSFS